MKLHTRKPAYGYEKGNLQRKTESPQIAAQNNTISTNYVEAVHLSIVRVFAKGPGEWCSISG